MSKSYDVDVQLSLDFTLLHDQITLLCKMEKRARGRNKDMLAGIVDLLEEIQVLSAEHADLSDEIVYGPECVKCEENFHNGVVRDGEFLCEKCAKKG